MSSKFYCSYMEMSSFSVNFFFQSIYTDYANKAYFDIRSHFKSSLLKPKSNLVGMVLGWVPFKYMSDSPTLHTRWLLLLKIGISSIVHCCFIINQNELKPVEFFVQPIYTNYAN